MDRENANFQRCLDELTRVFGTRIFPLQLPVGEEHDFKGVIDLTKNKAIIYSGIHIPRRKSRRIWKTR